jgi:hypothetical protein
MVMRSVRPHIPKGALAMKKSLITTAVATVAITLAGAGALAAASSVGTTPEPQLISRFQGGLPTTSTPRHQAARTTPTTFDDHGNDTSTTGAVNTPTTVDDHGNDTPTTFDDHGNDTPTTGAVNTPTTVDDHGNDTPTTSGVGTPTTIDDHGGRSGRSGSDDGPSHS